MRGLEAVREEQKWPLTSADRRVKVKAHGFTVYEMMWLIS